MTCIALFVILISATNKPAWGVDSVAHLVMLNCQDYQGAKIIIPFNRMTHLKRRLTYNFLFYK